MNRRDFFQSTSLSHAFEPFPCAIIYSDTPENMGPVVSGDVMKMHIGSPSNLSIKIV